MAFAWKIVEVAGMDAHTRLAQQADRQLLVTLKHGDAQHDVPSAFDLQARARGMAGELAIEFREIHAQTIEKNGLDLFALIEQHRRRLAGRARSWRDKYRR